MYIMSLEAAEREYLKHLQNKVKQSKNAAAAAAAAESTQEDLVASAIASVAEPVIKKGAESPSQMRQLPPLSLVKKPTT
jgi:hypothetical protein